VIRALITGLGIVSPAGSTDKDVTNTIKMGLCPVKNIPNAKVPEGMSAVGAVISDKQAPQTKENPKRASSFLLTACEKALKDAQCFHPENETECAVIVGTSLGDIEYSIENFTKALELEDKAQSNTPILNSPHDISQTVSEKFNLTGPKITLSCACTSGTSGMGLALDWIRSGKVKRCLVTAVDTINDFVLCGFSSLWALTSSPPKPFDTARTGMALGETAIAFVVEAEDQNKENDSKRAIIEGYGASCDAVHVTAPDRTGGGAQRAIEQALKDSQWSYKDVEYLNVHATGSLYNDSMILKAIENVFKEKAAIIPISSVNPCTGHTLGAAGLAELYATILASENSFIPPTPNLTAPERKDLNLIIDKAVFCNYSKSISLTTGFGGANTALAISVCSTSKSKTSSNLSLSDKRKPVITGAGWVTPFGTDKESLTQLKEAVSNGKICETLPELDFHEITGVKNKRTKKMDALSKTASLAAHFAFEDSGLTNENIPAGRGAVVSGSAMGASLSIHTFANKLFGEGPQAVNPNIFPSTSHNIAGGHISIQYKMSGPLIHFASGNLSSHQAIIYGANLIESGRADIVLCGGWEQLTQKLSKSLEQTGKPPLIPGAVMFIIESQVHADKRGKTPMAKIITCYHKTTDNAAIAIESISKTLISQTYGYAGALELAMVLNSKKEETQFEGNKSFLLKGTEDKETAEFVVVL